MDSSGEGRHLGVGHEAIDSEHRIQVGLLDAVAEALEHRRDRAVLEEVFEQLIAYTTAHFLSEQLLMRHHAYPEYADHTADHEGAVERLHALHAAVLAGDPPADAAAVVARMRSWLLDHIQTRDRALGAFLARAGRRQER